MHFLKIKNVFSLFLLLVAFLIQKKMSLPTLVIDKQTSAVNVDIDFLKYSVAPITMLTTDLYWIMTLMESDLEHYKGKDLNSWMFLRFKTITELDPNFLKAYQFGGQYLNIIKDDLEGSSYIFEKGLQFFPNDYELISASAFLYTFELKNKKRAIDLYEKAIQFPNAPEYFKSILSKLRFSENQDPQFAFNYLLNIYKNLEDSSFKKKLGTDLYGLRAMIDLKCLNQNLKNCNPLDFFGEPYFLREGRYHSKLKTEDYKLFHRQ